MEVEIFKNVDDLIKGLAKVIFEASKEAITARGQFNLVLSGGKSPKKLYELMASNTYKNKFDWEKINFFFGDERYVAETDARRNSVMIKKVLFDPLNIAKFHIFNVHTRGTAEEAAQRYSDSIAAHFHGNPVEFDFVLLGLGEDAHTASLFPNTSVLEETEATIKAVFVKDLNMHRITMTAPLINKSRHIAFLVFGENKAEAVYQVVHNNKKASLQYPATLINSENTKVQWFLDTAASAQLQQ